MSRVESPFHAIAAQALDDTPDTETNGSAVAPAAVAAAATVVTISDARGQERESMNAALEPLTENGRNEAADKNDGGGGGVGPAEEVEVETAVRQERKVSAGVSSEGGADLGDVVTKKSKKRTNVWTKTTSRRSAKKGSVKNGGARQSDAKDDNVLLKPFHQEDDPTYPILLSKIYKAEKIELSVDRLAASGSKGYRMVRATRGVGEGAWYFEIQVERLGDTGHTRLGWSTRRGDLQAPVGYDAHSYAYRDVDGSKVHAALREDYGSAYHEKDVIGFYINLPREAGCTLKEKEEVVGYKGQPYTIVVDEPLKPLPGSEILFFKNGVCQGVAFRDINDGSYFPAASMYTLPSQDCCKVVFNFGPDFKYPPTDLQDRPFPSPMCKASGPGEARVGETTMTTQTDMIADFTDTDGAKQQMARGDAIAGEVEGAATATKEESAPKDAGKIASAKKKAKMSKVPLGKPLHPPLSEKPNAGELQLNQEFKRNVKAGKNDNAGVRLGSSTSLPIQKGAKKVLAGTGVRNGKGIHKETGLAGLPGTKIDSAGAGWPNFKGSKKGVTETASQNLKGSKKRVPETGMTVLKGKGLPGLKGSTTNTFETGVQSFKWSKKDVTTTGLQSIQGKKDSSGAGFHSSKGNKRDASGSRLQTSKRIRTGITGTASALITSKGSTGTGSALNTSKGSTGTGSALHKSKGSTGTGSALHTSKGSTGTGSGLKSRMKNFPGAGSVVKASKKHLPGTGFVPRISALSGRGTWGDGIRGTTMDVDVVVVEPSTSRQVDGSFR